MAFPAERLQIGGLERGATLGEINAVVHICGDRATVVAERMLLELLPSRCSPALAAVDPSCCPAIWIRGVTLPIGRCAPRPNL